MVNLSCLVLPRSLVGSRFRLYHFLIATGPAFIKPTNGTGHSCEGCAVILKFLSIAQYPLPHVEDYFGVYKAWKCFRKLDILEIDDLTGILKFSKNKYGPQLLVFSKMDIRNSDWGRASLASCKSIKWLIRLGSLRIEGRYWGC